MKNSSLAKKVMAVTLAAAVAVGSIAAAPAKSVSAAKKAKTKSYTVSALYAGNGWAWVAGDGKTAPKVSKKVKITKGKKTKVSLTIKNTKNKKITAAQVFTVDVEGILKDYKKKNVKISGLTVKADGKKKSAKIVQGQFEPKTKPNNYRLSIYNAVGTDGDNSKSKNKAKNFAFKKKLTVSFTIVAK
ncbi:MAG: hypothetical protein J1E62_08065 [Lachnospiraceae bacterium]|nr:hypothetical protein [Lachnospiraceae bacterium]